MSLRLTSRAGTGTAPGRWALIAADGVQRRLEGVGVLVDLAGVGLSLAVCFQLASEPVGGPEPCLVGVDPAVRETAQQHGGAVERVLGQVLHQLVQLRLGHAVILALSADYGSSRGCVSRRSRRRRRTT